MTIKVGINGFGRIGMVFCVPTSRVSVVDLTAELVREMVRVMGAGR